MADHNKTEPGTPRRRQKAREQGRVVRSRDLVASVGALAAVILLAWQLPAFAAGWRALLRYELDFAATHPNQAISAWRGDLPMFRGLVLAIALGWLVATAAGIAQGGLVFAPSALVPSLNRLSPALRLQQLFSVAALGRMLKTLVPTAVIVYLAASLLTRDWTSLPSLPHSSAHGLLAFTAGRMFELAWEASLALLVWSVADYLLERWRHENELKMSRQDLRDEFREIEGNPMVKMRLRRLQRQARRRHMVKDAAAGRP